MKTFYNSNADGEEKSFASIPLFAGAIEYRRSHSEHVILGMLQSFVPSQGDAWSYTLDAMESYFERMLSKKSEMQEKSDGPSSFLAIDFHEIPHLIQELIGGVYFVEMAALLGKRKAELHLALSSVANDSHFALEPFSLLYQSSLYQSM